MPTVRANGIDIYYEEAGTGFPLIFCHEFAGDMRSWEPQVRHFSRRYRVVTFNYRGYPPSTVPPDEAAYKHETLVEDLHQFIGALGISRAHIAGLATGGNLALNFAIQHPSLVAGLVVAGAGAGTVDRKQWLVGAAKFADDIERDGTEGIVANIVNAPQRVIFKEKDPRGWASFIEMIRSFSAVGCTHMMRNALMNRKPIFELKASLEKLSMPILVMVGDRDLPAAESSRFIQMHARHAGLMVIPMCGHTLNSEEPGLYNMVVADFIAAVDAGHWGTWKAVAG